MTLLALTGLVSFRSTAWQTAKPAKRLAVIELFAAVSCYSCRPPEAYLNELAEKKDFINLALRGVRRAGRLRDVHSNAASADHQPTYA